MATKLASLAALALALLAGCAAETEGDLSAESSQELGARRVALSASTVEELGDQPFLGGSGPLGPLGPIGAWGPLGALGPVGDNSWNPSQYIPAFRPTIGGPMSEQGPLGPNGPLGKDPMSTALEPGGYLTVLGPIGPLGALGPLGPLGPVGGHGYAHDEDGNYLDRDGHVVRTVEVPYEGEARTYELVEKYTERAAKSMRDNDTSFMAIGTIEEPGREADDYAFTSRDAQLVTLTVVPENSLGDFDLEVKDASGRTIVRSSSDGKQELGVFGLTRSGTYVDFAQISVAKGEKLTARVTAKTVNRVFPRYRLIVVGSTRHYAKAR